MNLDLLIQGVAADIIHNVQTTVPGDSGSEEEDFEAMLLKQSQAAKPQRKEEAPKDKADGKQETEESQKNSTKGQETTEKGQEVAAALVTSQPVVPFELVAGAGENTAAVGLEGAVQSPVLTDAAVWVEDAQIGRAHV